MSQFAKSERIGTRSMRDTPLWQVFGGGSNKTLALGLIWRNPAARTWEARTLVASGDVYLTSFETKAEAEDKIRRQEREYWATRVNVADFLSRRTARRSAQRKS